MLKFIVRVVVITIAAVVILNNLPNGMNLPPGVAGPLKQATDVAKAITEQLKPLADTAMRGLGIGEDLAKGHVKAGEDAAKAPIKAVEAGAKAATEGAKSATDLATKPLEQGGKLVDQLPKPQVKLPDIKL